MAGSPSNLIPCDAKQPVRTDVRSRRSLPSVAPRGTADRARRRGASSVRPQQCLVCQQLAACRPRLGQSQPRQAGPTHALPSLHAQRLEGPFGPSAFDLSPRPAAAATPRGSGPSPPCRRYPGQGLQGLQRPRCTAPSVPRACGGRAAGGGHPVREQLARTPRRRRRPQCSRGIRDPIAPGPRLPEIQAPPSRG